MERSAICGYVCVRGRARARVVCVVRASLIPSVVAGAPCASRSGVPGRVSLLVSLVITLHYILSEVWLLLNGELLALSLRNFRLN
jgi:hypothetical protein